MTAETYGEKLLAEVKEEKLSEVQYSQNPSIWTVANGRHSYSMKSGRVAYGSQIPRHSGLTSG